MRRLSLMALVCFAAYPAFADWRDDALAEIKTSRAVKDAIWSAPGSLWIGVLNDGTRRDGFAEYACQVVSDARGAVSAPVTVRVWDIAKMAGQKDMVELGRARCS